MSAEFYARIERGNALPSVRTFCRLIAILDISADLLLGLSVHLGDSEPESSPATDVQPSGEHPDGRDAADIDDAAADTATDDDDDDDADTDDDRDDPDARPAGPRHVSSRQEQREKKIIRRLRNSRPGTLHMVSWVLRELDRAARSES